MSRTPTSTYRLQITADFDLYAAAAVLPYLHDLGVDWVYLSPILTAEPGSSHGYDVVDPTTVDPTRGGAEGLAALSAEARRLGMGVLVDIVPNHMGIATASANAWWSDALEHGPDAAHAGYFDIDWAAGGGKVLLPVLEAGAPTIEHPHYAESDWRRGDAELNYRRFFTVSTLAGVRVEDPVVFEATHAEIRRWLDERLVDGLRIDHPDGLRDPAGYLDDLAELSGSAYTVVEKILEPGEALEAGWAASGTTGYDVLGQIDRVLVDPAGEQPLTDLETRLRGHRVDWPAMVLDAKRDVASTSLLAEVRRIARDAQVSTSSTTRSPDPIAGAVVELLAAFPVYRSYLPAGREHLDAAFVGARAERPDLATAYDELEPILGDPAHPAALRFQQTSGMVMAKGVEDRSFYRYSRLTSLNEVGGDPAEFALDVDAFHAAMAERQATWPAAMTTLSTHDTKRSEDVRARIAVLAEAPEVWAAALDRLLEIAPLPDAGFGNLLWQAAYGAWPIGRDRLHAYAEKAMREAGEHTTWTDPDETYERAVHVAVDAAYDDSAAAAVLDGLVDDLGPAGESNGLAAKLLSLTIPGVPDVYQGSELGDRSLVDPDNRRPVDFAAAARSLADESLLKQRVTATALRLRRDRPELFTGYSPVTVHGYSAGHALAFDRGGAITVVTRLPLGLERRGGWGDTGLALPPGVWRNALDGAEVGRRGLLSEVLAEVPVALLVRDDG